MGSIAEAREAAGDPGAGGIVARPRLFERLGVARVTVVSAPAGSGKTVLLRSWLSRPGTAERAAWLSAGRRDRDQQRFWLSALTALRETQSGLAMVRAARAAPNLDGWGLVERLLSDLAPLDEPIWLVIDDVHELDTEARQQLELLILRAPPQLKFVLATRHEVRLGLHRLRLEGELVEIGGSDLRFTLAEAEELFDVAGLALPGLALLVERAEGWVAGLRLAALSLAGHPNPERFAEEFSGVERTVAEYLLAEVLDRQSESARRLLLRTSILDSVNGELARVLSGESLGERMLQDLEAANAFVTALDESRSWFRYHRLFADLLELELRRTEPNEIARLNETAAHWFAEHGYPVEAVRHAQNAHDWDFAAQVLADHWPGLYLDGQSAIVHELLVGFPSEARAANAELAAVAAGDELTRGSLEAAERYVGLAECEINSLPDVRQRKTQLLLGIVRLLHARQRANLPTLTEEAQRLQVIADRPAYAGLGEDMRALALISVGSAKYWAAQFEDAERYLDQGVALARRIGRPYLEFTGLVYAAIIEFYRSASLALEHGRQAVELAEQHGWTDEPSAAFASLIVGCVLVWQARLEEAEPWIQRAERTAGLEAEQAVGLAVHHVRGWLELARGRDADALAAFQAADQLAGRLARPTLIVLPNRAFLVQMLVRIGETQRAEQAMAALADEDRDSAVMRISLATLRLAQGKARDALDALAPVLDGSAPVPSLDGSAPGPWPARLAQPFLLKAMACDTLGDQDAAGQALERALDCAEPDGALWWFLLHPVSDLLERHARHRTSHASLISEILSLLAGHTPASRADQHPLLEPLSKSEIRVLRYLPTHLTIREIAAELFVSINTVRTHMRHVYAKLGTHSRAEAVARARDLGLLAPSAGKR